MSCRKEILTTLQLCQWHCCRIFINKFEQIEYLFLIYFAEFENLMFDHLKLYPANIYLFKVSIRNTRKRCDTCSKLTSF